MKRLLFIIFIFILSCSEENIEKINIEKISDRGAIYSISEFLDAGFKKIKNTRLTIYQLQIQHILVL